jgi:hypothetical protein
MKKFVLKHILFIIYFLPFSIVIGQVGQGYLPVSDFSNAAFTLAVHEVNFEGVPQTSNFSKLPYSSIKGSPFYLDQFNTGDLYGDKGKYAGRMPLKLNLASQEVYFIGEKGKEYVAPISFAKRVIIFTDTSAKDTLTIFERNVPGLQMNGKPISDYVEEMVSGKLKLYRYTRRYVASADSMFGTLKRYYFASTVHYFVSTKNEIQLIKKMNLSSITDLVEDKGSLVNWAEKNKINPKKEEDLIALIKRKNFEIAQQ